IEDVVAQHAPDPEVARHLVDEVALNRVRPVAAVVALVVVGAVGELADAGQPAAEIVIDLERVGVHQHARSGGERGLVDLRGSFTGYGGSLPATLNGQANSAPTNLDRPDFTGHVDGRLDVTRDFDLTGQARLRVATDNPGSPNIQAGLARYPVLAAFGSTVGFDQRFNRLQVSAGATVDRTVYQNSTLTDGETASNDDRNFNQYGG